MTGVTSISDQRGADREPLTRERVLEAALAFVDQHGLEALSMRKLGAELGVEAMSLYNHVPNKEAILQGLVELVFHEIDIPSEGHWEERLRRMASSFRTAALAHPNVFPLLISDATCTPAVMRPIEAALDSLRGAGVTGDDAVYAYRTAVGFIMGYLNTHISGFLSESAMAQAAEDFKSLPRAEFPCLHSEFESIINSDSEAEFEVGMTIILTGLKHHFRNVMGAEDK